MWVKWDLLGLEFYVLSLVVELELDIGFCRDNMFYFLLDIVILFVIWGVVVVSVGRYVLGYGVN